MTVVALIAQRILDENNYSAGAGGDITLTNMEYLIKNAVDHINLHAGTTISFTPAAGAASLTADDDEIIVVKDLSVLRLRTYLDRGPNVGVSSLSVTATLNDPQYTLLAKAVEAGIVKLRNKQGVAFMPASDDADIT